MYLRKLFLSLKMDKLCLYVIHSKNDTLLERKMVLHSFNAKTRVCSSPSLNVHGNIKSSFLLSKIFSSTCCNCRRDEDEGVSLEHVVSLAF